MSYINLFSKKKETLNLKIKKNNIIKHIKSKFNNFILHNDPINNYFSKSKPDLLLNFSNFIIIIQIDKTKKIFELPKNLESKSIVLIKFNPDSYINQDGIKIKSCWKINKYNTVEIINTKISEWNERINILNLEIQYWIDNKEKNNIEVVELFYNNFYW